MKILLINPIIIKKNFANVDNLEPLGLLYVAGSIKNCDISILDGLPEGTPIYKILDQIINFSPNIIGISVSYSTCIKTAKELSKKIKEFFPNVIIIAGGNAATFTKEYLLKNSLIDIVVMGEGEITFNELIENLKVNNYKLENLNVKGIAYKNNSNEIIINEPREIIHNLDLLPKPAHYLLPNKNLYIRTVLVGRGCPYDCIYCSTSAFFGQWRKRSISNILDELDILFTKDYNYKSDFIAFIDDNFVLNTNWVIEFCKQIKEFSNKINKQVTWSCNARIEKMTDELLYIMRDAGCTTMFFGIESGSERVLKLLNRRYTPDDVVKVTNKCKELGIHTVTAFIIGLPFEDKEDIKKTYELIDKIPDITGVCILTAFPGTPLYNTPEKFNIKIEPHLFEEDNINQAAWVNTQYLTREEVLEAYYKAIGMCLAKAKKHSYFLGK